MATKLVLQPTLWRTCRALANRTRLRILQSLVHRSPQTVSAVALDLKLPLPVVSQALRALEARSLLAVQRLGRRVEYRVTKTDAGPASELLPPLYSALRRIPIDTIFRSATAFTHPRRLEVFRVLNKMPATLEELQSATSIPAPSLRRHLQKLTLRGFVVCRLEVFSATTPPGALDRALARLASISNP